MTARRHYDTLETRDPAARERDIFNRLPAQIAHAIAHAPAFARMLEGVDPRAVDSREALASLPVTRKSALLELQKASRPFGGFAAAGWGPDAKIRAAKVFASPGPLYEPEGRSADYWRLGRALVAAGFEAGDLVHNTFAYHFTPAGSMVESAAAAIGCTVFPAGTGQTEMQVQAIAELKPNGYVGTPSFLKIILDKADETGADTSSLKKALVSGEAFPASLRDALSARGIDGYQAYASADLGCIGYESTARSGLIVDEGVIVEIVRPGTGDPVPPGEVGEVVVTTFNRDYPLIRFGTGDLSAVIVESVSMRSPCGRTNVRLKGWLGRADQTTKVKGLFVHPSQVADIVRRHPAIARARLVVDNPGGTDRMTLHCELKDGETALPDGLADTIRDVAKVRGEVAMSEPMSLPNDGKVIDDIRRYE
nr:phenylacetate-coenzyme A ligase [uncultured bacterium]